MHLIAEAARVAVLPDGPPLLQVVVDTEEEFDWGHGFGRENVAVTTMRSQHLAQDLFAPYDLKPTYVIDYPCATSPEAVAVIGGFHAAGLCQIGAHLHPWVNPPHSEMISTFNSYPGNLPAALEREKMAVLGDAIATAFGAPPTIYKAGRYGVGQATATNLKSLGYLIDLSVVPQTDFSGDGGPDFRGLPDRPYWIGDGQALLEIPLSRGFSGVLANSGSATYRLLAGSAWRRRARLPGLFARLGLLERATLTPEGIGFDAHRRLVEAMLRQGHRVFTLTYHSTSLEPGHTPYVRNADELAHFLANMRSLLAWFFGPLGGRPTTPDEIRAMALTATPGQDGA